jgi:hypothetical protein
VPSEEPLSTTRTLRTSRAGISRAMVAMPFSWLRAAMTTSTTKGLSVAPSMEL